MLVFCSLQFSLKSDVYYPVLFIYDVLQYLLCTWATTSSLMGAVKTAGSGSEEEASVIKNQKTNAYKLQYTHLRLSNGRLRWGGQPFSMSLEDLDFQLGRIAGVAPQHGFCRQLYSLTNPLG